MVTGSWIDLDLRLNWIMTLDVCTVTLSQKYAKGLKYEHQHFFNVKIWTLSWTLDCFVFQIQV